MRTFMPTRKKQSPLECCHGIKIGYGMQEDHDQPSVLLGLVDEDGNDLDFIPYTSREARKFAASIIKACDEIDSGKWKEELAEFADGLKTYDL